jgi:hypothetical protein
VINDNFELMGIEKTDALHNLNTVAFFLAGMIIMMILTLLLWVIKPIRETERFTKLFNALFFSSSIRLILESYIEISLSSMLNLSDL